MDDVCFQKENSKRKICVREIVVHPFDVIPNVVCYESMHITGHCLTVFGWVWKRHVLKKTIFVSFFGLEWKLCCVNKFGSGVGALLIS